MAEYVEGTPGTSVLGGSAPKQTDSRAHFDRLFRRYHKQAYGFAYRMTGNATDAEDLTQEAFLRAFRFFHRYRADWPFELWLYRIMSNRFIDGYRRQARSPALSLSRLQDPGGGHDDMLRDVADLKANPELIVVSRELDERIMGALTSLPAPIRRAVILADIEGLSYEEIGATMSCTLGTVRSRLNRGRRALRARLGAFGTRSSDSGL
jgi:RNA polymerase sigma-70 factor (ECF subfamily)